MRQLGDLPGDLDAGRPAADDDEGQPRAPRLVVVLDLGFLEGAEDPLALGERVGERLHPGRELRELVVPEVRLPDAGADDEAVVGKRQRLPVRANRGDLFCSDVDRRHVGQLHRRVLLALQDVAGRRRDLSCREDAGGDLVEQRLEEMVVRPVDERHLDRRVAEEPGREETAEAGADDHDSVRSCAPHRCPARALQTRAVLCVIQAPLDSPAARTAPPMTD